MLLGLYPILLAILPQIVILYLSAKAYHQRAELILKGKPIPESPPLGTPPQIIMTNTQYRSNLQAIQNTMGNISDIYDAVYHFYKTFDWSHPAKTKQVLTMTLGSMLGSLVIVCLIPINYLFLVGGVYLFLSNTAIVKAANTTLTPVIMKKVSHRVDLIRDALTAQKFGKTIDCIVIATVFENQRWWAGKFLFKCNSFNKVLDLFLFFFVLNEFNGQMKQACYHSLPKIYMSFQQSRKPSRQSLVRILILRTKCGNGWMIVGF